MLSLLWRWWMWASSEDRKCSTIHYRIFGGEKKKKKKPYVISFSLAAALLYWRWEPEQTPLWKPPGRTSSLPSPDPHLNLGRQMETWSSVLTWAALPQASPAQTGGGNRQCWLLASSCVKGLRHFQLMLSKIEQVMWVLNSMARAWEVSAAVKHRLSRDNGAY